MRMKGVLRKKPLGFETIDLRQLEMVCRMGNPFEAFSMMALWKDIVSYHCDSRRVHCFAVEIWKSLPRLTCQ